MKHSPSATDCERPCELARFPCPSQPKPPRLQTLRRGRIARICAAVCRPRLLATMPNSGLCRMKCAKHSESKADLHHTVLLCSIVRHSPVCLTGL